MNREIYLDNSATTRQYDEVTDLMAETAGKYYGNPSSLHKKGIEAERILKSARMKLCKCLDAKPDEIYFTSGGTESNNLAVRGYLKANPRKGRHIITTKIEHASVMEIYKMLEKNGYEVDYLNVDERGIIKKDQLRELIRENTALISIILVNSETGSIQPLNDIVAIRDALNDKTAIHMDAVQAFGKLKLHPGKSGIELMSVSSHKIHGPKGVGALYVSKSVRIKPVLYGGGQESEIRSGTENIPGIAGFGLAAEKTFGHIDSGGRKVAALKEKFIRMLEECSLKYVIISPEESLPYILNVSFPGLRAEVLLHHLEERGIYVSTGSACSSRKNIRSHVLTAMGFPPEVIDGAIRFSFSVFNTEQDIEETIKALEDIVPVIQIKNAGRNVGRRSRR